MSGGYPHRISTEGVDRWISAQGRCFLKKKEVFASKASWGYLGRGCGKVSHNVNKVRI
jgi:hypothetical protein